MGVVDGYSPTTLQFVVDALRTLNMGVPNLDMTMDSSRQSISTNRDTIRRSGRPAVRNGDGTAMTIAQIAAAANMTVAQVTDIAGRLY